MREPHLGRESQSPEANETIYSNIHSGCYRLGVRELVFDWKFPHTVTEESPEARDSDPWRALSPKSTDFLLAFLSLSFLLFGFPLFK